LAVLVCQRIEEGIGGDRLSVPELNYMTHCTRLSARFLGPLDERSILYSGTVSLKPNIHSFPSKFHS